MPRGGFGRGGMRGGFGGPRMGRGPVMVVGGPRFRPHRGPPVGAIIGATAGVALAGAAIAASSNAAARREDAAYQAGIEAAAAPNVTVTVAPPPQQPQVLPVCIPPGVAPGAALDVNTPDGQVVQCVVPAGLSQGMVFQISYVPLAPFPSAVPDVQVATQQQVVTHPKHPDHEEHYHPPHAARVSGAKAEEEGGCCCVVS